MEPTESPHPSGEYSFEQVKAHRDLASLLGKLSASGVASAEVGRCLGCLGHPWLPFIEAATSTRNNVEFNYWKKLTKVKASVDFF